MFCLRGAVLNIQKRVMIIQSAFTIIVLPLIRPILYIFIIPYWKMILPPAVSIRISIIIARKKNGAFNALSTDDKGRWARSIKKIENSNINVRDQGLYTEVLIKVKRTRNNILRRVSQV